MTMIASLYFSQYTWTKRAPHYYCSARRGIERWLDLHGNSTPTGVFIHRGDGEFRLIAPDLYFGTMSIHEEALCRPEVFRFNAMPDHKVVQQAMFLARREITRPERVITALALLRSEVEEARDYVRRKRLPARTLNAVLEFAERHDLTVTMHSRAALARVFPRPTRA